MDARLACAAQPQRGNITNRATHGKITYRVTHKNHTLHLPDRHPRACSSRCPAGSPQAPTTRETSSRATAHSIFHVQHQGHDPSRGISPEANKPRVWSHAAFAPPDWNPGTVLPPQPRSPQPRCHMPPWKVGAGGVRARRLVVCARLFTSQRATYVDLLRGSHRSAW